MSFLAPYGAKSCSPGREPGDRSSQQPASPLGAASRRVSPLRGSDDLRCGLTPGSRPGLHDFAPYGAENRIPRSLRAGRFAMAAEVAELIYEKRIYVDRPWGWDRQPSTKRECNAHWHAF